jgi:hypothetical protein
MKVVVTWTPRMRPKEPAALGYSMLLYPTTVIFRVTRAIQQAVEDLKAGRPIPVSIINAVSDPANSYGVAAARHTMTRTYRR